MAVSAGTPISLVNAVYGTLVERAALGRKRLGRTLLRHYVHDVMQTITELPQQPVLVGHSMGSYVVMEEVKEGLYLDVSK